MDPVSMIMGAAIASVFWIALGRSSSRRAEPEAPADEGPGEAPPAR